MREAIDSKLKIAHAQVICKQAAAHKKRERYHQKLAVSVI
jgi:hypothetical protein